MNRTHLGLVALAAAVVAACGDGATPASQTGGDTFLSERRLHETGLVPEVSHPVVLRLEGDVGRVHSGDLGGVGEDVFDVRVGDARRLDLHLAADSRRHVSATLVSADGATLATLDAGNPSEAVDLDPGQYQVRIGRTSNGGDLLVFFRDGTVSRDCERCDLSALQAGRADLSGVSFRGSVLRNAVLASANCNGTNFTNADLEEAMLSGADCRGATFLGANLFGASIVGADMAGTDLTSEQRESLNALRGGNRGLGTASQFTFAPQDLTVTPENPLVINAEGGGATSLNFGSVTIQAGGQIHISTSAHLTMQTLLVQGSGSAPTFVVAGGDGAAGPDGPPGTSTGACPTQGSSSTSDGGNGGDGADGQDAPFVSMSVGEATGPIMITAMGGGGGEGGNGGTGGLGGSGGDGGQGGAGGLGSDVVMYYQGQTPSDFQAQSVDAAGGQGGAGGAAGASSATLACSPETGDGGSSGAPGTASVITVQQTQ